MALICGTNRENLAGGELYFCESMRVIGFDRDGGFDEFVLVPKSSCMPLPEGISYEQAVFMVDMLGTPFRAFSRAGIEPGECVAVWGAGPIRIGLLMTAQSRRALVAMVDTNANRRDMARGFGSDLVLDPDRDDVPGALGMWTGGWGVRVGFDCVASEIWRNAQARPGGAAARPGDHPPLPSSQGARSFLRILGAEVRKAPYRG